MGTMRLVVDGPEPGPPTEVGIDRLATLLGDRRSWLWLDISDPGPTEVELLRREFGFHELALEEVTRPHERTRCNAYGGYYFIVVYAAEQAAGEFSPRELNLFWGENYLVTIHRRPRGVLAVLDEARSRWEQHEGRKAYGVACLAYTLFESLVDSYFGVEDQVRERMEGIEKTVLAGAEGGAADLFRLRKELLRVPRLLAPTSHVLAEVLRRERAIPEGLRPVLRRRAGSRRPRPGRARHPSRPPWRRARCARVLSLQPAGSHHEAVDRDHRHHHGAELRCQHLFIILDLGLERSGTREYRLGIREAASLTAAGSGRRNGLRHSASRQPCWQEVSFERHTVDRRPPPSKGFHPLPDQSRRRNRR